MLMLKSLSPWALFHFLHGWCIPFEYTFTPSCCCCSLPRCVACAACRGVYLALNVLISVMVGVAGGDP